MKTLLVLGASAVQSDLVREASRLGHRTVVCAASEGPAMRLATDSCILDFSDREAVVGLARSVEADAVVSVGSDIAGIVAADVSEQLELPTLVSSITAELCNSKGRMRERLASSQAGVGFEVIGPGDLARLETAQLPVFVKPASAQGQRAIALAEDRESLRESVAAAQAASRDGHAILEEYLDGPELSANGYVVDGRVVFTAVSDRETWPAFVGLVSAHRWPSVWASSELESEVHALLQTVVDRMNIEHGSVYAQVKLSGGRPRLVEVAPRLDGCHLWRLIRAATGVDLLSIAIEHTIDGRQPSVRDFEPTKAHPHRLDFICQPTGGSADYSGWVGGPLGGTYYNQGDEIRSVNGRFEKIGYSISAVPE